MYASSSDTFYKYYAQRQRGGALASVDGIPVFRAAPRRQVQGGAGLGDILRSAFRWFLPVAMRGASTFANTFLKSHDQGATFREAAKAAIGPTLGVAGEAIRSRLAAREKEQQQKGQTGTGRKRRGRVYKGASKKRRKTATTAKKRKQVGKGRRRKAKKQIGGRKKKQRKQQRGGKKKRKTTTTKRRRLRRATSVESIGSYNF